MKVLFISNGSPLSAGGAETRCLELARNLVKLNSKVVIIAGKTKNHYKNEMVVDGIRIYHVNIVNFLSDRTKLHLYLTHLLFPTFSIFKIIKVIKEFKPDIIDDSITTSSIPFPSIAPFFKAIGTRHEHYSKFWPKGFKFWFSVILFYCCKVSLILPYKGYIAVSQTTKRNLINSTKKPVYFIPNGINLNEFKVKANEKNEILVFGRLVAHKNHKTLIRAMTLIEDIKLRIIGEGPLKNNLIRLSKRLGIRDRVLFDGYVNKDTLLKRINEAKIVVVPSLYEGFGIVVVEAMACKKAIIASDIDVFKELIKDNYNGMLFKKSDANDLASKIIYLLKNEKVRSKLKKNAYKTALNYDWKNIAKKYLEIYNKIKK